MPTNHKGFTLIELLIVISILGILAAIAIPIYSNYREGAYRAAAKAALVEGAQNMERFYTRNNTYVGATIGNAATDQVLATTDGAKYALTLPTQTATTFSILATPSYADKCGNLSITQTGAKSSSIAGPCW